jgi:hypothetical protein
LQSSSLGFDLSRISSGSFGGYGTDSSSAVNTSNTIQSSQTYTSQPVKTPLITTQSQLSNSQPLQYSKLSLNQFAGITLYH